MIQIPSQSRKKTQMRTIESHFEVFMQPISSYIYVAVTLNQVYIVVLFFHFSFFISAGFWGFGAWLLRMVLLHLMLL